MSLRILFFVFFFSGFLNAQINISQEKSIDSILSRFSGEKTPGCVLSVLKDGNVIYAKGYGSANLDYDIPLTPQSVFPVFSLSEQFTAACISILVAEGKLNLKDNLRKYLPELPDFGDTLRVLHLLNHTSGLRDYLGLMDLTGSDINAYYDADFALRIVFTSKGLNCKPGTEYISSASDYLLLGELVKRVSSKALPEFARLNIFEPLGMTNTFFNEDCHQVVKDRACGYKRMSSGSFEMFGVNDDAFGDHGLFTCTADLSKWDENFKTKKVGGEPMHKILTGSGTMNSNGNVAGAVNWNTAETLSGMKTMHIHGQSTGYRTTYYRFPDSGLSIIFLCNRDDALPGTASLEIASLLTPARFKQVNSTVKYKPALKTLQSYTGNYRMNRSGITLEMVLRTDTLKMKGGLGGQEHELLPVAHRSFIRADAAQLQLMFMQDNRNRNLLVVMNDGNKAVFYREELPSGGTVELTSYAGTYYCPEWNVSYFIKEENGNLMARLPNGDTGKLKMGARDEWNVQMDNLQFIRNPEGKITGFMLSSKGKVANIRFNKN
jgi:CubicO group peptidase (beta-lactamase class C family)